jgi:hypothetical protein
MERREPFREVWCQLLCPSLSQYFIAAAPLPVGSASGRLICNNIQDATFCLAALAQPETFVQMCTVRHGWGRCSGLKVS